MTDERVINYNIVKCDGVNYETEFEKQYYELKKDLNAYCFEKQELILFEGIRDDDVKKIDHSFVVLEVRKCNDETIVRDRDIVCRSDSEIDEWLSNKKIGFRFL